MSNKKKLTTLTILIGIMAIIFLGMGLTKANYDYLLSKRLPKLLAILVTAVAIALSSTIFQTVVDNRILTPSILGLDSLYILIQTLVVYILGSSHLLVVDKNINFAITVAIMVVFSGLLYRRLFNKNRNNIMYLLLVGIVLGTLFQSLSSFMQMVIDPNEFLHIQDMMFASFNNVNIDILIFSSVLVIGIGLYLFTRTRELDVLSLGRDSAINLGVNYERETRFMLFLVSILVSVSTALVGPISFLGLLVVNLSRELLDSYEHRYLLIASSLIGIFALVGGQILVEKLLNFSIPISVIINFIGGVYFIYLLLKESIR